MKKIMLFVLAFCLCFTAFGAAFAETAATEASQKESKRGSKKIANVEAKGLPGKMKPFYIFIMQQIRPYFRDTARLYQSN